MLDFCCFFVCIDFCLSSYVLLKYGFGCQGLRDLELLLGSLVNTDFPTAHGSVSEWLLEGNMEPQASAENTPPKTNKCPLKKD